jgi:hypothetical protein
MLVLTLGSLVWLHVVVVGLRASERVAEESPELRPVG